MSDPCPETWPDTDVEGPDPADALAEGYDPTTDVEHEPTPDAGAEL